MIGAVLATLALSPWSHPLGFAHLGGWTTGRSGDTRSVDVGLGKRVRAPLDSSAWMARGVHYQDDPTADPPNRTLRSMSRHAVIVWTVVYELVEAGRRPIRLALGEARRFDCYDAAAVPGGEWELTGAGPGSAYSVIVRIYFGSAPTRAMRMQAERALKPLQLPAPR